MKFNFAKFIKDEPSIDGFQSWLESHETDGDGGLLNNRNLLRLRGDPSLFRRFIQATHDGSRVNAICEEIHNGSVVILESGPFFLLCKYSYGTFRIPRPMADI